MWPYSANEGYGSSLKAGRNSPEQTVPICGQDEAFVRFWVISGPFNIRKARKARFWGIFFGESQCVHKRSDAARITARYSLWKHFG